MSGGVLEFSRCPIAMQAGQVHAWVMQFGEVVKCRTLLSKKFAHPTGRVLAWMKDEEVAKLIAARMPTYIFDNQTIKIRMRPDFSTPEKLEEIFNKPMHTPRNRVKEAMKQAAKFTDRSLDEQREFYALQNSNLLSKLQAANLPYDSIPWLTEEHDTIKI